MKGKMGRILRHLMWAAPLLDRPDETLEEQHCASEGHVSGAEAQREVSEGKRPSRSTCQRSQPVARSKSKDTERIRGDSQTFALTRCMRRLAEILCAMHASWLWHLGVCATRRGSEKVESGAGDFQVRVLQQAAHFAERSSAHTNGCQCAAIMSRGDL